MASEFSSPPIKKPAIENMYKIPREHLLVHESQSSHESQENIEAME